MTTKKNPSTPAASAPAQPTLPAGPAHKWQGQGVEPGSRVAESAEHAATRAAGNASAPAHAPALTPDGKSRSTDDNQALDEDPENTEEKRQAAAEEHAVASPKHYPHGRL